jgi:hypothetical protein
LEETVKKETFEEKYQRMLKGIEVARETHEKVHFYQEAEPSEEPKGIWVKPTPVTQTDTDWITPLYNEPEPVFGSAFPLIYYRYSDRKQRCDWGHPEIRDSDRRTHSFLQYNFSQAEFVREMNRPWNRK